MAMVEDTSARIIDLLLGWWFWQRVQTALDNFQGSATATALAVDTAAATTMGDDDDDNGGKNEDRGWIGELG